MSYSWLQFHTPCYSYLNSDFRQQVSELHVTRTEETEAKEGYCTEKSRTKKYFTIMSDHWQSILSAKQHFSWLPTVFICKQNNKTVVMENEHSHIKVEVTHHNELWSPTLFIYNFNVNMMSRKVLCVASNLWVFLCYDLLHHLYGTEEDLGQFLHIKQLNTSGI